MVASKLRQRPQDDDYDLLTPAPKRRRGPVLFDNDDVSDAQFVVVARHTGEARARPMMKPPRPAAAEAVALASARAIGMIEAVLERLSDRAFAVLVALIFGMVFMFASGVFALSRQGQVAAVQPLDITHVSLTPQDQNGMRVLLINGIVENNGSHRQTLAPIRAELVADGRVLASLPIAPPAAELGAGKSLGFAARVQHPGGKTPQLRLSFDQDGAN